MKKHDRIDPELSILSLTENKLTNQTCIKPHYRMEVDFCADKDHLYSPATASARIRLGRPSCLIKNDAKHRRPRRRSLRPCRFSSGLRFRRPYLKRPSRDVLEKSLLIHQHYSWNLRAPDNAAWKMHLTHCYHAASITA